MAAALLLVVVALPATAQAEDGSGPQPNVVTALKHGVSQPLRDLPTISVEATKPGGEIREINPQNAEMPDRIRNAAEPSRPVDMAVQNFHYNNNMPEPDVNFEGVNNISGYYPPDTTGDVGPNHYIQWVNVSFQIFNKNGTSAGGPYLGNVLWTGFGGSCETDNLGDPIVLYDHLADRWLMTQFTNDNHQCIALSQTGDPLGAWYLYSFLADAGLGYFNDYPKLGVWPDGYYYSANMFGDGSAMAGVFERDAMLNGDPAQFIWFYIPDTAAEPSYSQLPADLDGLNLPPAGAPNPFVQLVDDAWGYNAPYNIDGLVVKDFHVDWDTPGNSTFTVTDIIDMTGTYPFDSNLCGYSRNCIPQPDTVQGLDALSSRVMYRLQYRNFGDYQTLLTSHSVDANGADHAGVRWYELRDSGDGWGVEQAQTFAPDSDNRWMGDLAMDASGNIAVGFSVSSSTVYPSIRWAGRLAGDPAGTLAQGEAEVYTGSGSQTGTAGRWGDYSTMAVDPVDDCTFWYTQEFIATTGGAPWRTRIAAFKFPSCTTGPSGTVEGTVTNAATMLPIEGATVEVGGFSTATDATGFYTITVPVDTYDVTASKFGFAPGTALGVEVIDATTTVQDFELAPVGNAGLDGYVTDIGHGWPLYAMIEIESGGINVGTAYTNPFNGYYDVVLPQGQAYDLTVTALSPNYNGDSRSIVLGPAGQTESFVLAPISPLCTTPGYTEGPGAPLSEDFGGAFPPAGWTVVNNGGSCVWVGNNPGGRANLTGGSGAFAVADSDACGSGTTMNTNLVTPVVDVSTMATVILEFKYDYYNLSSGETAAVDISANGGGSWTNLFTWNTSHRGPATYTEDVTALVGGSTQAQIRFRYIAPGWDWWFEVDDVKLFDPADPCTPIPGTLVAGYVSDANSAEGLVGADVSNSLGGMTETVSTSFDPGTPEGYYSLFTPLQLGDGPSTVTFTASASGYAESVVSVNPTPSTAYRLDFALEAGWLEMVPAFLESRLYAGETENQPMSIFNYGGIDTEVEIGAALVPSTFPHLSPITDTANLPGNTDPTSMGRAPATAGGLSGTPNPNLMLADVPAFAVDVYPGGTLVDWPNVTEPAAWNVIAGGMGSFFGGDFLLGDFSKLYVVDYDTNTLLTVDTTTGAQTVIGPANPVGGESWSGITASNAGMLYASSTTCSTSTLYTIDPGTGTATPIGPVSNAPCLIDIAVNAAGELFGVDIINDNLVQIDPGSGAGTVIGSLGVAANYAQGMDFDDVTGVLYWAAYTASGELRVIDTATGASTLVGAFPGGAEVDSFAIASFVGGGLPWLVMTPDAGVVPAAGMGPGELPLNAEFIADEADHYGLYQAKISVLQGTPYDVNDTWVCFTKSFNDMTPASFGDTFVNSVAGAGITSGCGGGNFCPGDAMTRGVMARWLLLSKYGPDYSPPPCQGIFSDVSCEDTANSDYIEALYNEGITAGCSTSPLKYCPDNAVNRGQMAVFLLKTLEGSDYVPPACTPGFFADVVCPNNPFSGWAQELYERNITAGCGVNPLRYCPTSGTRRDQMAVFVQKTFGMPMCGWED
jgi:hypothetical protein